MSVVFGRLVLCGLMLVAILPPVPVCAVRADVRAGSGESDADLKGTIRKLLKDLESPTRKTRAGAEKSLLELGTRLLPLLPPPELLPNVSVREAVRRIRNNLERKQARESVRPSKVSLRKTASLEELLVEVSRQSKNPLDVSRLPMRLRQRLLSVDFKSQEFWRVLDDLAARTGFHFSENAGKRAIQLVADGKNLKPRAIAIAYAGAFRVAVVSAVRRAEFGDVRVRLQLQTEPRLRPLFLKHRGNDVAAVSDGGITFKPRSPDAKYELPLGEGGRSLKLQADFLVPDTAEFSTVNLKGRLTMQLAAAPQRIAFRDLPKAAGTARRRGGVTVTLKKVKFSKKSASEHEAVLSTGISYDFGGPAFETHRTWIFHNEVYLEDKTGKRIELNGGYETEQQADGGVAVAYRFLKLTGSPGGYRFIYVAPTLIIDTPIDFAFPKLPVSQQ